MAWPPDDLCLALSVPPALDDICLPGGVCLRYVQDAAGKVPHASDMVLGFVGQLGPAMAPLAPVFNLIDGVLAAYNCIKAIPDAITSLDPGKLLDCVPALAAVVDQLLHLVPQLSLPKLVKACLTTLAGLLRGIAADLRYTEAQLTRISQAADRAALLGDARMAGFLVCAQGDHQAVQDATVQALAGLSRFILLLNLFMGLFGGPEIPCLSALVEDGVAAGFDEAVAVLTDVADVLAALAGAIPDPDLALTLALGRQEC
jgi:hypothetical protein